MSRGRLWASNLKKKPWFRLWLYSLGLMAVLAFFSSSLMRYHLPIGPFFLHPERVTQVKDYSLQSSHPFTIGPIDNFENRDRISKFEFYFNTDKVKAAATIFDFGTNVAPIRLYVFNNQLKILIPGGLKRGEAVQNLTLIDEIQPKKSYKFNLHTKNGTFIHISIDDKQVLDLDEPGLVNSGLLSIGSNLDGGQVFVGSINKIKIREGVKEFRTSKIFITIFWISFLVGLAFIAFIALDNLGIKLSWNMPTNDYVSKMLTNTFLSIGIGMIFFGLIYYIWFFINHEYLPTPFVYAKSETFTDYFHTLVWTHREGRYTIWHTVYPPLIFLVLKWITPNLHIDNIYALRIVANHHIYWLIGLYFLVPAFVLKTRIWDDWTTVKKILAYLAIICSAPLLFSLERGNLIFIMPLFMALALSYPNYFQKICLAILINLKPYFIIFYFGYLIKRQWKDFLVTSMVAAGIFCIGGLLLLDRHFYLFFINLVGFSGSSDLFTGREVIGLPSSIGSWSYFLKSYDWTQLQLATGFFWSPDPLLIKGIDWVKTLVFLICIILVIKARNSITLNEWFLFSVSLITNSGVSVSGYSLLLYYPLIPVILKIPKGQILIGFLVLISWPWDIIELFRNTISNVILYFPNRLQYVEWTLGFGAIIRPFLNLLILIGVSYGIYRNSKLEKGSFINSKADIA